MPSPWAWLRSLLGRPALQPALPARAHFRPALQARYDNAQWTDENQRNWWSADYLSAKSANNFQVRRQLRLRSRYELSNNPYLYGICTSNADHLVSTGPTLQCLRSNSGENRAIQDAWNEWCQEVELVEKLRTCKLARTVDGEGFLVLKTVSDLEHPVQLYPVDVEADQVTTPAPRNLQELWVDGLILHPVTGRPIAYDVLRTHPGDFFYPNLNPLECDRIKARWVIHWFCKFRPGQVRGVPTFTPALDLFAELRAFRKAVLAKAQIAANLTAVLESEGPADDTGTLTATPFESIPIDRGVMTTLPGGAKLHQYDNGDPSTSYEMFQEKCLGEAVRPLSYPLNLALGTSQKFNFSSARLDHIEYRNALDVERDQCQRCVLDRIFRAWLDEAVMVPGLLPRGINGPADVPHEWHWPGYAPLDPVQDAQADHDRISNGTLTWQQFWASRGYDWRVVMRQQEAERQEIERLKLVFGEPLKKTEKVDESDPQGEPPQEESAESEHQPLLEGYDPQQPRDGKGRFGEKGGGTAVKEKPKAKPWTRKEVGTALAQVIAKDPSLAEGQKKTYRAEMEKVTGAFTPQAAARFGANLRGATFYPDRQVMTNTLAIKSRSVEDYVKKGYTVGGAYRGADRTVHIDGKYHSGDAGTDWLPPSHGYAHEFTHVIDGPDHEISQSAAWKAAWKAEIAGGGISDYAKGSEAEGLAEFGRLVYASGHSREKLRQRFPQSMKAWEGAGL